MQVQFLYAKGSIQGFVLMQQPEIPIKQKRAEVAEKIPGGFRHKQTK